MIATVHQKVYGDDGGTYSYVLTDVIEPDDFSVMKEKADDYGEGYDLGRKAKAGDDLPHPSHWKHPENFWHGLRAALRGRRLDISLFMRVIER